VETGIWPRTEDCVTRPLRDIARDYLSKVLGKNCGYDQFLWRQEIIKREDRRNSQALVKPS
jgi:hypothetical protein